MRAHYSNDTTDEFVVTAKNGKDGSSGGGGKLYLHKLSILIPENSQAQLEILSQDSSKITRVTNELLLKMTSGLAANSFPPVYSNIYNATVLNDNRLSLDVYNSYPFDVTNIHSYDIDMTQAQITDTVIEL